MVVGEVGKWGSGMEGVVVDGGVWVGDLECRDEVGGGEGRLVMCGDCGMMRDGWGCMEGDRSCGSCVDGLEVVVRGLRGVGIEEVGCGREVVYYFHMSSSRIIYVYVIGQSNTSFVALSATRLIPSCDTLLSSIGKYLSYNVFCHGAETMLS
ncbi:hypothetical protein Tco_1183198 [Tanacetum coccineum]